MPTPDVQKPMEFLSAKASRQLPQHPDQHRPEDTVLLAVDQQFAWRPGR